MKKTFFFILIGLLTGHYSNAQITWEKLFAAKSTDVFRSVKEVSTGGYICAGYTADSTANDSDAYAVRLNTNGDTIWTYRYNGTLSKKDIFYKVIETSDGGFAFCGYTTSVTGLSDDILYLKLNSSGQLQWVKTTGGSGKDRAQDIIQIGDGSYFLAGYTTSSPAQYYDAFLYHVNSSGDSLWFRRYGSVLYDDANSVRALSNGGYLLGGQTQNGTNGFDQYLIRTDSNGDTIWTKKFGTTGTDNVEHIAIASNGFILAGSSNGNANGDDNGYIVKTDTAGTVLWTKTYGGTQPDDFHRVELTSDGGLVACGTTSSTGPALPNLWIMRMDSAGDSLWSQALGGDNHDHGYSGQQTSDGGYIICGHTGSFGFNSEDAIVIKMGSTGNVSNLLTYSAITSLISPTSALCGGGSVQVSIIVKNYGNDTLPNVPVTCNITGSLTQTLNATYNGALHPLDADTLVFTTPITTVAFGTYNFTFTSGITNDVYPAYNTYSTSVTVDGTTSAPTVTDAARCGNGSVTLGASGTGNIYWYNASSGGTQVATGTSYTTPSLTSTTTYYVQTGFNCPSARVPVVATINSIPANPVTTNGSNCGAGTVVLSATSANTVNWYDAASGGTLVGTGNSFTTPSISSTTTYYAEATNGSCNSSRVAAVATIHNIPAAPTTTGGAACGSGSFTLSATAVASINWYNAASGGTLIGTGPTYITPNLTTTTTYYALANDGVCSSALIPAVATINSNPVVDLGPDTSLVNGTLYPLDGGAGFVSYVWSPGGETTQTISPSVTAVYCVTVTDANTCTGTDCVSLDFSNGLEDLNSLGSVAVYPNPSNGNFFLTCAHGYSNANIQLVDVFGSVIKNIAIEKMDAGQTIEFQTESLSAGVYFIQVISSDGQSTRPIIIK